LLPGAHQLVIAKASVDELEETAGAAERRAHHSAGILDTVHRDYPAPGRRAPQQPATVTDVGQFGT
jgi:hypothetical protein